jgi:hypothetical protein|eukprot:CAMPEP_0174298796 /NCGR_PEP_ID=MMETSP0809-20121228/54863_1 /TAXON_ID=73025 ORGANISM="Eutreptiella gymnastica-like, Strain CCMP1594" /NCGR_SAMPLE_ID=MMETSP0809 /ASSEMBLY_ACC=CAM_ASM_000658 /LENGTH=94 /DNA_ID=CAMNT_0015403515 /DNA_START=17 /DNA_END=301 /DNA_ORIENTATION=+
MSKPFIEVTDWNEDERDRLAEEMGPIMKKFLIKQAGGPESFNYYMFEVLEVEKEGGDVLRCKCDIEHKGQFDATQKHFVRSYLYNTKEQAISDA